MKNLIILGSTGSIGTQALEVCRRDGYEVTALAAGSNIELLEKQAREFKPLTVAVFDEQKAKDLKIKLADTNIKVLSGVDGVCQAAEGEGDIVLNSIVGIAGLRPTLSAIDAGKTVALANKETLVTGGEIVNRKAREKGVKILPVDSEHSAIFQSIQGAPEKSVKKILLTASGGPFYGKKKSDLENVSVKEALNHPNWSMGAKITIDSASLMNKGLEVIEAVHLFGLPARDIEVLVHRQSIVHSMVEFCDNAVLAQLGAPDMKLPIQYAITYPKRLPMTGNELDFLTCGNLTFEKPDKETFRCLDLAYKAGKTGHTMPCVLNGANEEAVFLFLSGKIGFLDIAETVEAAMGAHKIIKNPTLDDILYCDKWAREFVKSKI